MQWQLIETAPKDGRTIFIWCAGECIQAAYLNENYGRPSTWYFLDKWRNWEPVATPPTHWMPLSESPNEVKEWIYMG